MPEEDEITRRLEAIFRVTHNDETLLGIGDDCAVLFASAPSDDKRFVVSTDILIESVHFETQWSTAAQIAKRAFAQNFADIAAQGARGIALVVSSRSA
ncbi:MAG: hypothetical protein LBP35_04950 [Candidatus Ancillula trichonymphae]|jgi:thiamine-monophosphate kinase|nr:hypothetical protein [Candidatus Ancillula trichonymphae]